MVGGLNLTDIIWGGYCTMIVSRAGIVHQSCAAHWLGILSCHATAAVCVWAHNTQDTGSLHAGASCKAAHQSGSATANQHLLLPSAGVAMNMKFAGSVAPMLCCCRVGQGWARRACHLASDCHSSTVNCASASIAQAGWLQHHRESRVTTVNSLHSHVKHTHQSSISTTVSD